MAIEHDRSHTFDLLARAGAAGTAAEERAAAFDSLAQLEDYRSIEPLTAMVTDSGLPDEIRRRASEVVAGFDDTTTGAIRRTWWAGGDPIVQRHALGLMTRTEADIVTPVAADDAHPFQVIALGAMVFDFGEASFMPILIRALRHQDPKIRWTAARNLLWSEPVAAEDGLLAAAHDADREVAAAALDTLRYYPTRRVLRTMAELRDHGDEKVRAAATDSFAELSSSFEEAVSDAEKLPLLRDWLRPTGNLIDLRAPESDETTAAPPGPRRLPKRHALPESTLLALLDDLDGDWLSRDSTLRTVNWKAFTPDERARLTVRLTSHPDPLIREIAGAALSEWSDTDALMELTRDLSYSVRKATVYHLASVPPDPAVADFAWQYLSTATGVSAQEALRTYLAHKSGNGVLEQLVDIARTDAREDVRYEAIHDLVDLQAANEIRALTPLLDEPPGVSWALHLALLDGLRNLELQITPPAHLATIDNLDLAYSLAKLTVARN
ncbi:HEAT repeat domain-containing protein [Nocardia inohanensis]|uniref:HEAT repeat domain-containing protein n=1 Tax=Nocardia inohanensis TaxID=209246 RepID=UPI000835EAF1|nr:HEAT repeat domain-containing protein [Nocardia inohanensis]